MSTTLKYFVLLCAVLFIASCSSGDGDTAETTTSDADEMAARIRTMEDSLFDNLAFDRRNAQMLMDVYKAYVAAYPLDNRAPDYLFRAASVARAMKEPRQSIMLYDRIISDYQGWDRLADAFYLKAFTIDTELGHKGDAREAYQQVIFTFPDHPFAKDARVMIENLEYTDEELIQRFQQKEAEAEGQSDAR